MQLLRQQVRASAGKAPVPKALGQTVSKTDSFLVQTRHESGGKAKALGRGRGIHHSARTGAEGGGLGGNLLDFVDPSLINIHELPHGSPHD